MELYQPEYLNALGSRSNNEDAIYPEMPHQHSAVFMVCDGVGGQSQGEVASKLLCTHFPIFLKTVSEDIMGQQVLEDGLCYVEQKMRNYIDEHPKASHMASTLTIIHFSKKENAVRLGWVGDSRVYHIRNGRILFRTKDHSEVQKLLDMGEISEEEALDHPRKHVITRAVNGRTPTQIDQKYIKGIQKNDFFLLCTDGILENLDERRIEELCAAHETPENIKTNILANAVGRTNDNYAMYLIKVKETKADKKKAKKWFWQH